MLFITKIASKHIYIDINVYRYQFLDINVKTVVAKKVEVKAGKKFTLQDSLLSNTCIM